MARVRGFIGSCLLGLTHRHRCHPPTLVNADCRKQSKASSVAGVDGLRHDLSAVIGPLLDAAAGDPVLADQIMRTSRPELDGRSLVDLLTSRRAGEVLTLLARYRDGYAA